MKKYKLICMSFDGEYQTEMYSNDIDELWKHSDNIGSKWFFYPFHFVCTSKTIKQSYEPVLWLQGKRIKTVSKLFNKLHLELLAQKQGYNHDEFLFNL
jgi:hypothetical protein